MNEGSRSPQRAETAARRNPAVIAQLSPASDTSMSNFKASLTHPSQWTSSSQNQARTGFLSTSRYLSTLEQEEWPCQTHPRLWISEIVARAGSHVPGIHEAREPCISWGYSIGHCCRGSISEATQALLTLPRQTFFFFFLT